MAHLCCLSTLPQPPPSIQRHLIRQLLYPSLPCDVTRDPQGEQDTHPNLKELTRRVGIKYIIRENKYNPADRGKHRLVRCSVKPSLRRDEKAGMFLRGRGHEIEFSHRARRMSLGRAEAAAAWGRETGKRHKRWVIASRGWEGHWGQTPVRPPEAHQRMSSPLLKKKASAVAMQ